MKATVESTDQVVEIDAGGKRVMARVWEGVTEGGAAFVAYITRVQVRTDADNGEFERALKEHKRPTADTQRAIDMRFII